MNVDGRVVSARTRVALWVHVAGYALMSVIMGFKAAGNIDSFGTYFTTWSWCLLMVFLWLGTAVQLVPAMWPFVAAGMFFLCHGVVWIVLVLFTAVVYSNPDALLQFEDTMSFSVIFAGEKVSHGLCVIVLACWAILNSTHLRSTLRSIRFSLKPVYYGLLVTYWYVGPLFMIGIYSAYHDAWQTYKSRLTFMQSFAIAAGTVALVNSLPLYVFLYKRDNVKAPLPPAPL
jgi:hypothetical protein